MGSLVIVILGSFVLGFFLIFLLALSEKKKRGSAPKGTQVMTRPRFEKACVMVVEEMKLEIDEVNRAGDSRIDIIARNLTPITGGQYLVHCLYLDPGEVVTAPQIIELSNMVLQERLSKGIFITTGRFTTEIPTIGELAPMEFIDGEAFLRLVGKYIPDYLAIRS